MGASSTSSAIDARAAREAAEWLVRIQCEPQDAGQAQALASWRAADPQHEAAWQRAELVMGRVGTATAPSGNGAALGPLGAAALRDAGSARRRATTQLLAALIVAGPAGYLAWRAGPWSAWSADVCTATGERRELQLPDDSRMQLDTGSAVDIAFTAMERRLVLRAGAVWIQTAADAAGRPFLVQTPQGTALALGTRYAARILDDESTLVVVREGAVQLRPARGGEPVRVSAGQQARMGSGAAEPVQPAGLASDGWTQGVLYAEKTPLGEFVAELSRYRPGILRCDPAVARLPVSGAFQLRDTDQALLALAASLPVRIHQRTRYWVQISGLAAP